MKDMSTIKISLEIKKKLEEYKEKEGIHTFNDAISQLLKINELLDGHLLKIDKILKKK